MAKLKVGIIGLGGIATSHCDAIATLDNVEVVAVADLFEEKRRQYMDKYDIPKGYPTHTDLLADDEIDAVAVVKLGHHSPAPPSHRRRLQRRQACPRRKTDGAQPRKNSDTTT